jgi:hypothetical protein
VRAKRLAIYTTLIGDKEPLGNPLALLPADAATDLELDFICFTDNKALESEVWKFMYIESRHLAPEKLSRRPKALPHEYLACWEYSLYIDNPVVFKRLPNSQDLASDRSYLLRTFRHATRTHLRLEADALFMVGYENIHILTQHLDFLSRQYPLDEITPLSTCTVILRSHHHPALVRFGITWWEQILSFSKRDQMSFDFCVRLAGCCVEHLPGLKHDNELIHNPYKVSGRILACFDPRRYAWVHRRDPEAVRSPNRHFLASGAANSTQYCYRIPLLDYICHKFGSSLGSHTPPRRQIADPLGEALAPYRQNAGRMLLLRIDSPEEAATGFLKEELLPAAQALTAFLPKFKTEWLEVSRHEVMQAHVAYQFDIPHFDIIVILGTPAEALPQIPDKFAGLFNPQQGLLAILSSGPGELNAIEAVRQKLEARFAKPCHAAVTHAMHDEQESAIWNSLAIFEWPAGGNHAAQATASPSAFPAEADYP